MWHRCGLDEVVQKLRAVDLWVGSDVTPEEQLEDMLVRSKGLIQHSEDLWMFMAFESLTVNASMSSLLPFLLKSLLHP